MISRGFQYQIVSSKLLKNMDGSSLGCIKGKMLMVGSVRSKCYQGTKLMAEAELCTWHTKQEGWQAPVTKYLISVLQHG